MKPKTTAEQTKKCPKCNGTKWYSYDENYIERIINRTDEITAKELGTSQPEIERSTKDAKRGKKITKHDSKKCEVCCKHDEGWWKLKEHYGKDNGKWCCRAGCGKTIDKLPESEPSKLTCEKHSRILIGKDRCVDCERENEEKQEECQCNCHDPVHERKLGFVRYCSKCIRNHYKHKCGKCGRVSEIVRLENGCPFCKTGNFLSKKQEEWEKKLEEQSRIANSGRKLYQIGASDARAIIRKKVGGLRQWLNEKPEQRLVTNEDIEYWLDLKDIHQQIDKE